MDLRTGLAAALGVGLGLVLLVFPEFVVRAQTAGRLPHDRGGEYGEADEVPERWRRIVQVLGLAAVGFGCYLAAAGLGWLA